MTDIREKVARAISGRVHRVIEKYPDGSELVSGIDHKTSLILADAALSACGYAELVEAVQSFLLDWEDYTTRNNLGATHGTWASADRARAALEKAGKP